MTSLPIFGMVLIVLAGQSLALEYTSSGGGGQACGDRICLKGKANCVGGECVCQLPYVFGNGFLNCYRKNEFRTEVTNDPRILTYNNNSIDLPIPCRYLLTHAVTEYKDQSRNVVGSCEMMVHAFHKKKLGKFYVGGYDVAIRVECYNGSRYEMTFRKYGEADNGNYDYYVNGTMGQFLPNGPTDDHHIQFHDPKTNLKVKCKIDEDNNLAIVEAKKCGFRINFRPYDTKLMRQQSQVPGLAVSVNCAYHPEFEDLDRCLALPPLWAHNGFTIHDIEIPGLGKMGTMIHRAYMSGTPQTQPEPNPACTDAKFSLMDCTDPQRQSAFSDCLWILRSPRFVRCYDKTTSGVAIQALFNKCVDVYCAQTATCGDVINMIIGQNRGCENVAGYPEKDSFFANCPKTR